MRIQGADAREKTKKSVSYRDLDIFNLSRELAVQVHRMTLADLPKFEMYETGSQIRRSSKSIVSNIVEGFGRRRYKNEFILFLTYAHASCEETKEHLNMLHETGSLNNDIFKRISPGYKELSAKLFNFREAVINNHKSSTKINVHPACCIK